MESRSRRRRVMRRSRQCYAPTRHFNPIGAPPHLDLARTAATNNIAAAAVVLVGCLGCVGCIGDGGVAGLRGEVAPERAPSDAPHAGRVVQRPLTTWLVVLAVMEVMARRWW